MQRRGQRNLSPTHSLTHSLTHTERQLRVSQAREREAGAQGAVQRVSRAAGLARPRLCATSPSGSLLLLLLLLRLSFSPSLGLHACLTNRVAGTVCSSC